MKREPVVAGAFYPGNSRKLQKDLENYTIKNVSKKKVIGIISPHAGYTYSGECAGKGFSSIDIPENVVILGVNHRGLGKPFAVDGNSYWNTPLGDIEINDQMRKNLISNSKIFAIDTIAGSQEHSIEVQIPFIQYINQNAKILPIIISSYNPNLLISSGKEIANIIKEYPNTLIVASSDMSHYISAEEAKIKDEKAIEQILQINPLGLLQSVAQENISMCGVCPVVIMLSAALELGAKSAEIIDYTHSGKVSGDKEEVVAYLSMIIY